MYQSAKNFLYKVVGSRQIIKNELLLRSLYAVLYRGNKHQCTICNQKLKAFIKLPNNDLLCPKCGSLARDRRLWKILNNTLLRDDITVLDFSPSRPLARKMMELKNINYLSTDLSGNFIAKYQYDITNIDIPSDSIDLIVCYHVLEHIEDDKKAINELYRVLKPGGKAIIQTPFKEGDIYEDFSITAPKQREIHFGQDDHVRIYSVKGLKDRLNNTGFKVLINNYPEDFFNGLQDNETIFIITK